MKHAHRPGSRTHTQRISFREIPRPERLNELLGVQPATTPHDEERARRRAEFAAENKRLAEAARQRQQQERQERNNAAALHPQGADQ
ncbi:hypothetical protein [Azohydromonas lata]|uniref:hypothetical protein n=1 Tax=Azohydromonas lata TaxID=45677 RepID=UPI000837749D|nr:hypothetical protein [Azohydromonas lata]